MRLNAKQQRSIKHLVESCFDHDQIDQNKSKLILNQLKKLPDNQSIAALSFFIKKLRSRLEKNTLIIESPTKLSNSEIRHIVAEIAKNHTVYQIQTQINPSLLTGIRVKIGDTVLEDNFYSRTQQLTNIING